MREMMKSRWFEALWPASVVLLAAACGGEDSTCLDAEGPCSDAELPLSERLAALDVDLAVGARGPDVRAVNEYLERFGYFPNADLEGLYGGWQPISRLAPRDFGTFEEATAAAVREFQRSAGLEATGIVDAATRAMLQSPRCGVPDGMRVDDPMEKYALGNGKWNNTTVTWSLRSVGTNLSPQPDPSCSGQCATDFRRAAVINVIDAAFDTWSAQTNLMFQDVSPGAANIEIRFQDLASTTLAATFYPDDFGDDAGGDMQIDSNGITWSTDGSVAAGEFDLQTTVLHELGHALGIAHSSYDPATMDPFGSSGPAGRDITLDTDDTVAISTKYDDLMTVSGAANDIGIGADGSVWIITTTKVGNNYTIQKRVGNAWVTTSNGTGRRISVAPNGRPWVVADDGTIWRKTSSDPTSGTWDQIGGCAKDIGIGGTSGNGTVWVVGCNTGAGGFGLHFFDGVTFQPSSGSGTRIAVDATGTPWVVANNGTIWRLVSGTWVQISGTAIDIGVGPANFPWIVTGAFGVSASVWNDQRGEAGGAPPPPEVAGVWRSLTGAVSANFNVAVDAQGRPWMTNISGIITKVTK